MRITSQETGIRCAPTCWRTCETPRDPMTERPLRFILFAVVAGLSLVFLVDLCDLIYDCGCRSLWHGAARACNIHRPQTPDCPWCSTGTWGLVVPAGAIVAAQALVLLAPGRARTSHRVLLAVALFPVVGGITGVLFGLATGYWSG